MATMWRRGSVQFPLPSLGAGGPGGEALGLPKGLKGELSICGVGRGAERPSSLAAAGD